MEKGFMEAEARKAYEGRLGEAGYRGKLYTKMIKKRGIRESPTKSVGPIPSTAFRLPPSVVSPSNGYNTAHGPKKDVDRQHTKWQTDRATRRRLWSSRDCHMSVETTLRCYGDYFTLSNRCAVTGLPSPLLLTATPLFLLYFCHL